jgi:hypothetical protein
MITYIDVLSWILSACLLAWAVYERILSQSDKSYIKSSIRIWQHQAQGISKAIQTLTWASLEKMSIGDKFSNTKDTGIALDALHDVAESMSDSLYESRFFTDDELKENMRRDSEEKKPLGKKTKKEE